MTAEKIFFIMEMKRGILNAKISKHTLWLVFSGFFLSILYTISLTLLSHYTGTKECYTYRCRLPEPGSSGVMNSTHTVKAGL